MLRKILLILSFTIIMVCPSDGSIARPVNCEEYDHNACSKEGKCDFLKKTCDSENDKPQHCFVLWHTNNVTMKLEVWLKGCFTQNQSCNQTECVDKEAEMKKNNMNFCCCSGDMCNRNHRWEPTTTEAIEVEVPTTEPYHHQHFILISSFSVVISFFIVFVGFGIWYFNRQKKHAMFNEIPTSEPEAKGSSSCLALRPIELVAMKARGRFGAVWHGQMKGDDVAVKIFPVQDKDSWMSEQEIYKLARMMHPNILEFIGAEKHTETLAQEFWLITAYHSHGSLCDYLKANTVTWQELLHIAESMSRGLMHLHEEIPASKTDGVKPAIAHRDFKSKNVLLKHDLTACIADFGLALVFAPGKACGDTHGQVGTRRYMAPEVLEGAINFTRDAFLRIDVYACGLVLWELVSRCTAHNGIVPSYSLPFESELGCHPSLEEMQENVVIKKLRPKMEDIWRAHVGLNSICETMEECWDHDAEARLSSSCVMERIAQHTRYPAQHLLIETNTDNSVKIPIDSV